MRRRWICPGAGILSTRGTVTDGEMNALERVEQRPTDGGGTGTESTDVLHFMSVDTLDLRRDSERGGAGPLEEYITTKTLRLKSTSSIKKDSPFLDVYSDYTVIIIANNNNNNDEIKLKSRNPEGVECNVV